MSPLDIENGVLGSIIIDPEILPAIRTRLSAEDFETERGKDIFSRACKIADSGKPLDYMTLFDDFGDDEGTKSYIVEITSITPTAANAMEYARRLSEQGKRRRLAKLMGVAFSQLGGSVPLVDVCNLISEGVSEANRGLFQPLQPLDEPPTLPDFPVEVLPQHTRNYILAAAESVQAPLELVASCVLGTLEVACRGRYPVQLSSGHVERPCLYIVPIAQPSERKSGVMSLVTAPLVEYEAEFNKAHGGIIMQSQSELKVLQGQIAAAEKNAASSKNEEARQKALDELRALNEESANFKAVQPLRLTGADTTPEKLGSLLESQGGTFALVSAEGGGIFENIGRYCDKGGLELYLNAYSGDQVRIDRKNSESITIDKPTLTIIAPSQAQVVKDLFSDKQKTGRGLLSRMLFVKCKSRVGSRSAESTPIDEGIRERYHNLAVPAAL